MKRFAALPLVALSLHMTGCLGASPATHTAESLDGTYAYWLHKPAGHAQKKDWPLIVFLHGSGERGDNLDVVKKHGPPQLVSAGRELPFVIVSPQCPKEQRWSPHKVLRLVDHAIRAHRVDPKRVYLTGLSMGGYGTWAAASEYPERFAAIVPICGGGNPERADRIKDIPTWAFHGDQDKAVKVNKSQDMIAAMQKAGAREARLTVYPGIGHNCWTRTYENPKLYDWLLEHRLP